MLLSFGTFVFCFSANIVFTFSSSPASSSSVVTVVSSCTSTSIKTRNLHLHCAEGHIRILESFLGSLENRYFGCFHHLEDCTTGKEFQHCQGAPSCDVEVPRQTPILCTSAINDKRRVFSMSAYLQISYECTGRRPHTKAVCLSGPANLASSAANHIECNEKQHIRILNVLEGRKSFSRSQALSMVDPTSACSYKAGDELFQSPLSASIGLGCNGSNSCRFPSFSVGHLRNLISYMQIHFACEEGTSRSVSRCLSSPPSSEQDIPMGKRYLFLECSAGAIQILNSFFGSRSSGAVGVTSCGLRSNDVVYPTEVQTCDGRSRCYVPLQEQADEHRDMQFLYLQVHFRCLDVSALKQVLKPIAGSVSVRDYMSDSDQISSNILSDDAAAVGVPASSAQASRSASSKGKNIDHTVTIVGGILLGVCLIGCFVVAYVLDQKWKKRERLENSLLSAGNEEGIAEDAVAIVVNAETGTAVQSKAGGAVAKAKAGSKAVDDAKSVKTEATSGDKEVDDKVTESLIDLMNIAEARLQLNQSPTLPRKVDHLPEKCRENPPANVRHYIEKGEKQEFYV